jgi:hypothetical protein
MNTSIFVHHHASIEYNEVIMTSNNESPSVLEVCANVKRMGYAASSRVRLYGEDFDVLSDPFPEAGGIAIQAKAQKDSRICTLQLPTTFLKSVRRSDSEAA